MNSMTNLRRRIARAAIGMVAVAAVATGLGACASGGSGSTDSAEGLTPLKVGVLPYLDYHLFYVAHEMGFDKELGYDT